MMTTQEAVDALLAHVPHRIDRDVAGMSSIAEALGLSFSTDDYAGSVAGIVSRVAKLHAECFGLKAEAALAKSEPSQSVRDALDRLFDAIGSKDVGECIRRLQAWGAERAKQRQDIEHANESIRRKVEVIDKQVTCIAELRDQIDGIKKRKAKPKKKAKKKARRK